MTLTDTGPLAAFINRNDPNHARCLVAARLLPRNPLITSWPCFTEATCCTKQQAMTGRLLYGVGDPTVG